MSEPTPGHQWRHPAMPPRETSPEWRRRYSKLPGVQPTPVVKAEVYWPELGRRQIIFIRGDAEKYFTEVRAEGGEPKVVKMSPDERRHWNQVQKQETRPRYLPANPRWINDQVDAILNEREPDR